MKFIYKMNLAVILLAGFFVFFDLSSASAATTSVVGEIQFASLNTDNIISNNIIVNAYKVGSEEVWNAILNKDAQKGLGYSLTADGLNKNDQLVVTAEYDTDKQDNDAYYGGVITIITDQGIESKVLTNLNIVLLKVPFPVFEETDENNLKLCWTGISDFSVVGYEIYRSEDKTEGFRSIGRSGQNANKKVCFVDSSLDRNKTYYYRLAVMNSWNAGEGKEVKVASVLSARSDGMQIIKGVVDKKEEKIEILDAEKDQTQLVSLVEGEQVKLNKSVWEKIDVTIKTIQDKIKLLGWSYQTMAIIVIAGVLLLVILYFVFSVWWSNIRYHKKSIWE